MSRLIKIPTTTRRKSGTSRTESIPNMGGKQNPFENKRGKSNIENPFNKSTRGGKQTFNPVVVNKGGQSVVIIPKGKSSTTKSSGSGSNNVVDTSVVQQEYSGKTNVDPVTAQFNEQYTSPAIDLSDYPVQDTTPNVDEQPRDNAEVIKTVKTVAIAGVSAYVLNLLIKKFM